MQGGFEKRHFCRKLTMTIFAKFLLLGKKDSFRTFDRENKPCLVCCCLERRKANSVFEAAFAIELFDVVLVASLALSSRPGVDSASLGQTGFFTKPLYTIVMQSLCSGYKRHLWKWFSRPMHRVEGTAFSLFCSLDHNASFSRSDTFLSAPVRTIQTCKYCTFITCELCCRNRLFQLNKIEACSLLLGETKAFAFFVTGCEFGVLVPDN